MEVCFCQSMLPTSILPGILDIALTVVWKSVASGSVISILYCSQMVVCCLAVCCSAVMFVTLLGLATQFYCILYCAFSSGSLLYC